jgi:transketolase
MTIEPIASRPVAAMDATGTPRAVTGSPAGSPPVGSPEWISHYTLSSRTACRIAQLELARTEERLFSLEGDLGQYTVPFHLEFPNRFLQLGIAEADLVGTAVGLAQRGKIPFVNSFAAFLSCRACEQVRLDVAYHRANVKLVGYYAGLSGGPAAPTHHAVEDLAIMRALPNLVVLSPADSVETCKAVQAAAAHDGPVYIRVGRAETPQVFFDDYEFAIGKAVVLANGDDVALLATGNQMVAEAVAAGRQLGAAGIGARVLDVSTIKPLDREAVLAAAATGAVVTVEDHSVLGGLGGAVAELLAQELPVPLVRIGIDDQFCEIVGPYEEMVSYYGLDAPTIVAAARRALDGKRRRSARCCPPRSRRGAAPSHPARDQTALAGRRARLAALADEIAARRGELIDGLVVGTGKARRVAAGEVALALARLQTFDEVAVKLAGRAPVGTVAIVLPGNVAISNPVATIGTTFLAGNRVLVRFPRALRRWADQLEPLFATHLPGLQFDHRPGTSFILGALADPEVAVLMVFGDDRWAAGYEPAVRAARKKLIFEGPGKDPFLVLPGADLERAARDAVRGAFHDAGQSCTSPERFYVHAELAAEMVERIVELTRREVVGEPERDEVTVGPIVRPQVAARVLAQLQEAQQRGARTLTGGGWRAGVLTDGTAAIYVEPTVLTGVDGGMSIMRDETLGPIIPIQTVASESEAAALAASSRYGLTASLYGGTESVAAALAASHGRVFRDEIWLDYFGRHLHAPYGGRKRSGWVWAWEEGRFVHREGVRSNAVEMSRD